MLALLYPALTLEAGTKKIICEYQKVEKCYEKVGAGPVASPNCPTKKGWVIRKIPNCVDVSRIPSDRDTEKAAGKPDDNGIKIKE